MGERLTRSDYEKIKDEIEHRRVVVRKRLLTEVKEARARGDLSENFEYRTAKKENNSNDRRIDYLEMVLKNAVIIEDTSEEDEVGINNTVELYFENEGEVETYRLVTSMRGSSVNGLISIESPLGKAILGHKEGDRAYVKMGKASGYYVVIRKIIKTQSEENDKIRGF